MRITKKNGIATIADILVSLLTSVLSALSLLVFHYFRTCEDAASYYKAAGKKSDPGRAARR